MQHVKALTFDLFGTVLDLGGSLTPYIADFLQTKKSSVDATTFWNQWRARQRLEQYQDTIMMLGHSGYLETARRAFVYTLKLNQVEASDLVALSNGDPHFLEHLAKNQIQWPFDAIFSVSNVGSFKPHPAVYRRAATTLGLEVGECLMVSANSFDVVGARACGFRGAFVNRYEMPYEDTIYQPDVVVADFSELAEALV